MTPARPRLRRWHNEDYWQEGLPYLDSIEFRPLLDTDTRFASITNGDVDYVYGGYYQELSLALADPERSPRAAQTCS